jgi:hypothetical protein
MWAGLGYPPKDIFHLGTAIQAIHTPDTYVASYTNQHSCLIA